MIRSAGQPEEQPDLKKPTALRGVVGVWDRESGDRIKGCDGACIHAVGSLAGAGGWSITNVTAFYYLWPPRCPPNDQFLAGRICCHSLFSTGIVNNPLKWGLTRTVEAHLTGLHNN